jgi:hypothetical protein
MMMLPTNINSVSWDNLVLLQFCCAIQIIFSYWPILKLISQSESDLQQYIYCWILGLAQCWGVFILPFGLGIQLVCTLDLVWNCSIITPDRGTWEIETLHLCANWCWCYHEGYCLQVLFCWLGESERCSSLRGPRNARLHVMEIWMYLLVGFCFEIIQISK